MLAGSFRLVAARLIPRRGRCKQTLLVGTLILAGCGGGGEPKAQWQPVRTAAFRFEAPQGWDVKARPGRASATRDSELVQVVAFPLVHAYTAALFTRVETELASRMEAVARQTGGKVTGHSVVDPGGIRSHSYDVRVGDHVDEYTFVLRGLHEYQLLCRRKATTGSAVCGRLISSFSLG
jgi:hypothetical protein